MDSTSSRFPQLSRTVGDLTAELFPGSRVESLALLGEPTASREASDKAFGYGAPVCVGLSLPDGSSRKVVIHTATANDFGHDRRSDRAAAALLAFDTFGSIPRHVPAIDAGAIAADGRLVSLRHAGELYVLTGYAEGSVYAEDLARIAHAGRIEERDRARCSTLASYLVELHAVKPERRAAYTRAVRDLIGAGEGIFGIVDGYPAHVPAAPPSRLQAIEKSCLDWRWRLRDRGGRLSRTHGDFHPFNIVFDDRDALALLDASRGCQGDPADDVSCLALNYVFFAFDAPGRDGGAWAALRELWHQLWREYLEQSRDEGLLDVVAPFLAWRGLVLACPRWYPALGEGSRDRLLGFVERALAADRFDPAWADEIFG